MNIITLIILRVKLTRNTQYSSKEQRKIAAKQCRNSLMVCILLGMTWVFALLAVGNLKYMFQLLFCVFNSLQGFFIFVMYTSAAEPVRSVLRKYCYSESSSKRIIQGAVADGPTNGVRALSWRVNPAFLGDDNGKIKTLNKNAKDQ